MFEWFINVGGALKGRLPMFWSKCQQVYNEWLKQQPEPVPEQDQLNFNKSWIQDWKKEYNVSHRKPNKKYVIKKRRSNNSNQGLFKKDLDGKKGFYQQMRSWTTCYQLRPNAFALQRKRKSKNTYRIEQILGMILKLPNRLNMFTEQFLAICVLDDYCVHLMPEVRQALFKKGYVLVIIDDDITGDV